MINIEKVRAISSFFADNVDDLYVTKLMKLFYYVDFISYAQRGSSVTNDIYYKLPYGPVPSFIKNEIDILAMPSVVEDNFGGQLDNLSLERKKIGKKEGLLIKSIKPYDLESLSIYESKLIKQIAHKFKTTSAKDLTERTHREAPYRLTSANSQISYELARKLDLSKIL